MQNTHKENHLRGQILFFARTFWVALALLGLSLFLNNLLKPAFGGTTVICALNFTCPPSTDTLQILQISHIPRNSYDTYVAICRLVYALVFLVISLLIFWKRFDQPSALLASLAFLCIGIQGLKGQGTSLFELLSDVILVNFLILCLGLFLATFPSGSFAPRWSWPVGLSFWLLALAFQLPAPWGILNWPFPLIALTLILGYGSPIALQVYRYVRISSPAQRQQTRWVIFGLVCALALLFISFFSSGLFPADSLYQLSGDPLASLAFLFIPLSVCVAILRSRLWDIDQLIKRTLVYTLLTITLALAYFTLVVGAQFLLSGMLVGGNDGIVIVSATLIVAVLFQPLRRGIQNVIDRRFYRQKYDAARTLQAFGATLHQEIELKPLQEQIIAVVQKTVQPAHISLWLFKSTSAQPLLQEQEEG
ncbi:hypothetical protein KSD_73570 [Ktedonobacter sp. SOSP1-85]|uniref:hypothetical protein n=1 Tax=Ktedonobacter sp. SOSP1-85 TaxID=2778367 RepID=UPI001915AE75|nr:hypothetical protein [Ktedonobacter sp. SOSP1-85]GHO79586.1 hypothetical protein KSD_73570 [Ktedonobacter sp. SOSP1-85]